MTGQGRGPLAVTRPPRGAIVEVLVMIALLNRWASALLMPATAMTSVCTLFALFGGEPLPFVRCAALSLAGCVAIVVEPPHASDDAAAVCLAFTPLTFCPRVFPNECPGAASTARGVAEPQRK
jgi:hypothetical protein